MTGIELREGETFIKLSQAIKKAGLVENGAEAKMSVREERVRVNGEAENRPGRKLFEGDEFELDGEKYRIEAAVYVH